jgi:histidine triad (HIT) family protein
MTDSAKPLAANMAANTHADCIFCRIVRGEIPARKVYEDDELLAFHDISPVAPMHLLVIPKQHLSTLYDASEEHHHALGSMLMLAGRIAREQGAAEGFRSIINTGRVGGQEVYHLHLHLIAGPQHLGPMIVPTQQAPKHNAPHQ